MAEPTVAAGFARALLDLAVSKGGRRQLLLERSGISADELADQDRRIPLTNYLALLDAGVELCGEPGLSLQFGEAFSMPELSIVGLVGQSADTAAEAFAQVRRLAPLIIDAADGTRGQGFEIIPCSDGIWIALTDEIYARHYQLAESAMARSMSYFSGIGKRSAVKALRFTHEEPAWRHEYDRIFGVPITFASDRNALLVDEAFLSAQSPLSNRYAFEIFNAHADSLLNALESTKSLKQLVEALLVPVLHNGRPDMDMVAGQLGLSRQTLYRRLKAEGLSYGRLLDELRHRMAVHSLTDGKASVKETAFRLGFSDPTAFSRAFRRWTGQSPRTARNKENGP